MRIIPARAGFTPPCDPDIPSSEDHPRSRGVYSPSRRFSVSITGSSPLARGLLLLISQIFASGRIIPARAGFTWCTVGRRRPRTDHPRSRGVYLASSSASPLTAGSSPLARGLQSHHAAEPAFHGIIPARAGFTPIAPSTPASAGDHPRSRGVYMTGW